MVTKATFTTLATKLQGTFSDFFDPRTFQNPPSYNVVTEVETPGATDTVGAVRVEYDASQWDGQQIQVGDFKLLALVADFVNVDPQTDGVTVTVDDKTCQIIRAEKDAAEAMWTLQVRAL